MSDRYRRILDTCQPYLISAAHGGDVGPRPLPFGLAVAPEHVFDPFAVASGPFLQHLQRLDELTFGPVGMPMPRWVFYDCAELPGGIVGFCRPAAALPEWVRRALSVPNGHDGPVPLSMYVAIPMLAPGCWHTYTLCSLGEVAPGTVPANLALLTEALGLSAFPIETAYGATQWRSPKLAVHLRFGPLELVTAWTPAHSDPTTLTFRMAVDRDRVERALSTDEPAPVDADTVRWLDCDEPADMQALQAELETGRRFQLVGQPVVRGACTRMPIQELS
ncbi:hypothetical protein [Haliangium sp.]|uniref:hypothetical protein n=1 Tax=Haliangium sp. TaxID=2663208 RepID=UPI003D09F13B